VKYLIGLFNLYSKKAALDLYTGTHFDELTLTHTLDGKMASVVNFDDVIEKFNENGVKIFYEDEFKDIWKNAGKEIDFFKILQNMRNNGFAVDFGANYRLSKRIELNASVLDLGFIKWKTNTKQYCVENQSFSYAGFENDDFFDANGEMKNVDFDTYFGDLLDSIANKLVTDIEPSASYVKWLNARINLGGSFYLGEKHRVNAVFNAKFINGKLIPSGTLSYTVYLGRWFDLVAGNTFRQNALFNPGVGFNLTAGLLQFYTVVNYVNSLYIDKAKNTNFAFGINFVAPKKKEKISKASYPY
jgi:hypothetical protein